VCAIANEPGRLISFEGLEGSGKSTQLERLATMLREKGHRVETFREPGATLVGEQIRHILLQPEGEIEPITELLLFQAARHQLVTTRIKPAIEEGAIVLLDRFFDATTAYQGYGRGIDLEDIKQLTAITCQGIVPDLTILLDIDPLVGLQRCLDRKEKEFSGADRIESSGLDFLHLVSQGYLKIAEAEPARFVVLRVTGDIESTFDQVVESLRQRAILTDF